jgi:hypothetical protein
MRVRAWFSGDNCEACADGFVDYPHCAAAEEAGSTACYDSANPTAYRGGETRTLDGRKCQKWSAQTPVAHGFDPASYADFGIGDHNECRNPTSDVLPWCYVDRDADVGISVKERRRDEPIWGYCGVVDCFAMDDVPAHSPRVEAQCSVVGEMTVSAWTSSEAILAEATPRGEASDADCASAALDDLHAGEDVRLYDGILVRTAMTATTAAPYVSAVAFEEVTGSAAPNDDRPAFVIYANMTFKVGGVTTALPYAGTTDAAPAVTAFEQTAFSATGVSSKAATATWIDGTVVTVVATECAACADAYRLDVNVKVPAASGIAIGNAACGGAGGDIANAVVTCVDDATPWFVTCPTTISSGTATGYCTTARAALETPTDASVAVGTAACRQCARVGGVSGADLEASCVAQVAVLGGAVAGPFADTCRARFANERLYERAATLDASASAWDGAAVSSSSASTLRDTVDVFDSSASSFPSMAAFRLAAAAAPELVEEEFEVGEVRYIAGTYRDVDPNATKTRGIPFTLQGSTVGKAAWPFPSLEDKCRGVADAAAGGGGFALYAFSHDVSYAQKLRVRACDSAFPVEVALYVKDHISVAASAVTVNGDGAESIEFDFTPWRTDVDARYEVRVSYVTTATSAETYAATTTVSGGAAVSLGDWSLPSPDGGSMGDAGFETGRLAAGTAVTVKLSAAAGVTLTPGAVTVLGVVVTAENDAQTALGYPPYAGWRQSACGAFASRLCGDMLFDAAADTEYLLAVTGRGVAEGTFDVQMMKLYGTITTLRVTSSNEALSLVATADGSAIRATPRKLARVGDALAVRVESGRPIDKPTIAVNGVSVRPGLVVGAGRFWEATFVLRAAHNFTDGQLNVTASAPAALTEPSRGFIDADTPRGADKALVIFDSTPPTLVDVLVVNVAYLSPLDARAPATCTDSDDVTVTAAKRAAVGDVVAVVFRASEPLSTVVAEIGGLEATVLMSRTDSAPASVKAVRDAWQTKFAAFHDADAYPPTDDAFGVAYATLTLETIRQGTLAFEIAYADAAGNRGEPAFAATGAPAGASAASSLDDRLRADPVVFDSFAPRPAARRPSDGAATANAAASPGEAVALSHVSETVASDNARGVADSFHGVELLSAGAAAFRLGDVVIADVAWTEPVTRPYGAYFQLASGGRQHVRQSDTNMRALARATEPGLAQCRQREFRPRAQELVSRAAGWGGRESFERTELAREWRVLATLADPCDVVGRGALAFARRNDCRAEDRGDGSFWIPQHARWCREGWGVLGLALPEAFDAAGNAEDTYFKLPPTSINNARAKSVTKRVASHGDAVIRAPVVLAGKANPSPGGLAVAGAKQPNNAAPSVVELYAEPGSFTWNMYRRVVKAGEYVVFHMYFDQPVTRVKLWVGDFLTTSVVRHEQIAPAYQVYKPCLNGNLAAWLQERGLVALDETFFKPADGSFDADDDFLDATINGNFASRVVVANGADSVPCTGFWVLKGPGGFRVKRLCARRKALLDEPGRRCLSRRARTPRTACT